MPDRTTDAHATGSWRVIVPTRNGGRRWQEAAAALARHVDAARVVAIDTSSTDGTDQVSSDHGFAVVRIAPQEFNHGRTRQWAVDEFCKDCEFAVFLTQDAVLESRASIPRLLEAFDDPYVGAAFGRQLPHADANAFARHFSLFNYGQTSDTRTLAHAQQLGVKAAYCSNSFAAYRIRSLRSCGGFPSHLIVGEDAYVAMRLLLQNHAVRYCADALVRHSHNLGILEEMRRYFDFGVMHAQIPELIQHFGEPTREGFRYVRAELAYVLRNSPALTPLVPLRTAGRFAGYRLGRSFRTLPRRVRVALSMTKGYWAAPA